MKNRIIFLTICLLFITLQTAIAQITSSPYSIFGAGIEEDNRIGSAKGMGGTGIGLLSGTTLNSSNPASYSGLESQNFLFELGFFGKYTTFSTSTRTQSLFNSNFRYLAMGFRISPKIATSFGIAPYKFSGIQY